ncbi:hypothetical protein DL93DRAFT_2171532 [Clavulina sp. PMI_390]|nr:hypothetical protein DL93DRAFT_2171532 [Clavulina sp. PMI_390]
MFALEFMIHELAPVGANVSVISRAIAKNSRVNATQTLADIVLPVANLSPDRLHQSWGRPGEFLRYAQPTTRYYRPIEVNNGPSSSNDSLLSDLLLPMDPSEAPQIDNASKAQAHTRSTHRAAPEESTTATHSQAEMDAQKQIIEETFAPPQNDKTLYPPKTDLRCCLRLNRHSRYMSPMPLIEIKERHEGNAGSTLLPPFVRINTASFLMMVPLATTSSLYTQPMPDSVLHPRPFPD